MHLRSKFSAFSFLTKQGQQDVLPFKPHLRPQKLHACAAAANVLSEELKPMKAAAMIIGDEILSGSVTDTNTPWLAKLLFNQGVDLVRVEYLPDNKEDIIQTARRLRQRVGSNGVIFSSGGIGPTHDDITYESLAEAFGETIAVDKETETRLTEHHEKKGSSVNAARLRMATLPTNSEILRVPGLWVPLVNLNGIYILPGIPRLFKQMIECHKDRFCGPTASALELLTNWPEGELAEPLTEITKEFPGVALGSYPRTEGDERFSVKIRLQSRDKVALEAAAEAVRRNIEILG